MKQALAMGIFIGIIISLLHNVLWLCAILTIIFSLRFGAAPLVPLAILIDGYFGNFYTVPFLSFLTIGWYLLVEYSRPSLLQRWSSS